MSLVKPTSTIHGDSEAVTRASKRRMVLWFCLIAALLVAAGSFYYFSELDRIRQLRASELSVIGEMKVGQIQRWRQERCDDTRRIVDSPVVTKHVAKWLRDPDRLANREDLIGRLQLEQELGIYFQALLVDAGQRILLSGASQPAEMETDSWVAVKTALTERNPVLSQLHHTPSGRIHIDIAAAIRDDAKQPSAVLVLTTDAQEFLFPMIETWPTSSRSGETLLVRRDGNEVLFLNELRHRKNTALNLRFPLSRTTLPAAQAVLGRAGIFYGRDYLGMKVVADLRPISGTDWFLVTKESESEIQGEVRLRAFTVFSVVLMLIFFIAGGMSLRYQTLRTAERKRTEELLQDSETRYRRLFEAAKDGILLLDAATGMIVDVNPYLIEILGYSHDQFLGKKVWELGFLKDVIANKDNFLQLQREKYVRYEDLPLETADGRKIDVEFVSNVYRVDHHEVIQCNIRNITDRKRMERELAQAKETQFRTLMETLPAKVFLKDRNFVYLSCNENYARDLKIKPEEIAGKTDYDFFPTHLAEKRRADDKRIMESGTTESREEEYHVISDYLAGSQMSYINIVKAPVRDKAGNVTGLFGLFWDITEQKTLEAEKNRVEALASATEKKSRFASMVSHELRSPLAVIKEALDIILEGLVGSVSGEQKNILNIAKTNIERLGRLINNVLDFKKIESGKMAYDIRENDINEVASEVHQSLGVLAKRKGLDLRVELGEGLPKMNFDGDKIAQVVTNLVGNAVKYTERGSITLSTRRENNVVHIMVRDTGVGISAEDITRIFLPFEQVDGLRSKQKGGTGLGLAISREIIHAHHGKIWAESDIGKGSTFHFEMPV